MTRPDPSTPPVPPGDTCVLLWPDRAAICSNWKKNPEWHRHHALQLSIALDGPIWTRVAGEPARHMHNLLVDSDQPHSVWGRSAQFYFEPESYSGRVLRGALGGRPWVSLDEGLARRCASPFADGALEQPETAWSASVRLIEDLAPRVELPALPDDRIWSVLLRLRENPGTRPSLPDLASKISLSPSRLRHLFAEQIGCPIREYVVWLRSLAAMGALASEVSISATAYDVGFADQPALSRAHRSTWGLSPSQLLRELHFPQSVETRRQIVASWRDESSLPLTEPA